MTEEQIVYQALENLLQTTQLKGSWNKGGIKPLDGTLQLRTNDELLQYNVAVKKELRTHLLPQILGLNEVHQPFMLIAARLFPKIKEELRKHNVSYLEANGNLYLRTPEKWFWIEANSPLPIEQNSRNRAFTKTGLRVLFEFLMNFSMINWSYRQIAEQTGTSIGNITHVMNGLKQEGFLVSITRNEYRLERIDYLLSRWITAYEQTLKPSLKIGRFRFLEKSQFTNWKDIQLNKPKTLWGGEPAGDLLTNFLKPAELTLYTEESRTELMKQYRLLPDEGGDIQVYQKFWQKDATDQATVPPLLVYADLINMNDRRCTETAQKIYNEYIQTELP
ncbi:type IV toxin-antitoxin system AbiEi family antitoxin [Telluribacter sp.]|jgi:hypothetical protein|uniref:type IV toxin-antitoxin system AbiEi family antitoxin n=1 Tax=Telluribacter sp. TaxID=1978767 RepID=UPI002E0F0CBE|nr:type IV toxin-antitoxin system AbiEi family antitoxin [Telluribacter sp.]